MDLNSTRCNIKKDTTNYLKHRTVSGSCYNKDKRKNNNNTLIQYQHHSSSGNEICASHQHPKNDNINNNRTFILRFSNSSETYLMNFILLQKQELIHIITKSLYQKPNIKAQTSDEIQLKEIFQNSTFVFDDMLLSKQTGDNDLLFTRGRHTKFHIYYISQNYCIQKLQFVIILIK